jgi:hypothetical protein
MKDKTYLKALFFGFFILHLSSPAWSFIDEDDNDHYEKMEQEQEKASQRVLLTVSMVHSVPSERVFHELNVYLVKKKKEKEKWWRFWK